MPSVKLKENEPLISPCAALSAHVKKPVFWLKFAAASFTKSPPLYASVKPLQLLSATLKGISRVSQVYPYVLIARCLSGAQYPDKHLA